MFRKNHKNFKAIWAVLSHSEFKFFCVGQPRWPTFFQDVDSTNYFSAATALLYKGWSYNSTIIRTNVRRTFDRFSFNLFPANAAILYPLKTPEKRRFFRVFRWYKIGALTNNGLMEQVLSWFVVEFYGKYWVLKASGSFVQLNKTKPHHLFLY